MQFCMIDILYVHTTKNNQSVVYLEKVSLITALKVFFDLSHTLTFCQGSVVCVMCFRLLCPYLVCFLSLFHVIMS